MDDPAPAGTRSVAATGAALLLAGLVALALNPGTPLAWAYDAPLPERLTLAAIRAGQWWEATGAALGLDRPAAAAADLRARLGAPQ